MYRIFLCILLSAYSLHSVSAQDSNVYTNTQYQSNSAPKTESIRILALSEGMVILQIGRKRYSLRNGESTSTGIKLIKADSEDALLEIDGRQQNYTLSQHIQRGTPSPSHYRFLKKEETKKKMTLYPNSHGAYVTHGFINKKPAEFIIDTGATIVAMSSQTADRLGIDYKNGRQGYASTASGTTKTRSIYIYKIEIGQFVFRGVEAAVIKGRYPEKILLGNTALRHLEMHFKGTALTLIQK